MSKRAIVAASNGPAWAGVLRYAISDATTFGSTLRDACSFHVDELFTAEDPFHVYRNVLEAAGGCATNDSLVVYFAGHGCLYHGELYLLFANSKFDKVAFTSLKAANLFDALKISPAKHKLLVLDCCNAGAVAGLRSSPEEAIVTSVVEDWSSSFQVLAAGERVSKARELDSVGGGFFTMALAAILKDPLKRTVSTEMLASEVHRQALAHNRTNKEQVPLPLFLNKSQGAFLLKEPIGDSSACVTYKSDYEIDSEQLLASLVPYERWDTSNIRAHMQIEIVLPQIIDQRVARLELYLETDRWPCSVEQRGKDQTRDLVDRRLPEFISDLQTVVRGLCVEIIEAGLRTQRQKSALFILERYVESKTYAFLRLLSHWRFHDETPEPWMRGFYDYEYTYGTDIINGLAPLLQAKLKALYWTDAHMYLGEERIKLYVPQELLRDATSWCRNWRQNWFEGLTAAEFQAIVGVQVLDRPAFQAQQFFSWLVSRLGDNPWDALTVRNEFFVDTIHFAAPHSSIGADGQNAIGKAIIDAAGEIPKNLTKFELSELQHRLLNSKALDGADTEILESIRTTFSGASRKARKRRKES